MAWVTFIQIVLLVFWVSLMVCWVMSMSQRIKENNWEKRYNR